MGISPDVQLHVVRTIQDIVDMRDWLRNEERPVLGLDIETSGLDAFKPNARIRSIQIGDENHGWFVPYEMWGGAALELLDEWQGIIALHNCTFDLKFLKKHAGWEPPWNRIHDTMLMCQIMYPGQPAGLKEVTAKYIDRKAVVGEANLKKAFKDNGWDWDTVPVYEPAFCNYSALDPIITTYLWNHLRADLAYPDVFDLEMQARRICTEMEYVGMRLDVDYTIRMESELTERVNEMKAWAQENWGINIASNNQLVDFLQNDVGATFTHFSDKTGNPSVNKEQLEEFAESGDPLLAGIVEYVQDMKYKSKLANTYFKNYREMAVDGIIHPSLAVLGASKTSRMSSANPNNQNLPSKDYYVRDAFLARSDDQEIWSIDFSSMELRAMAHFSQDPGLIHAFELVDNEGQDFFATLGKNIYNDPDFDKSDPRRKLVKAFSYATIYGASVEKMAQTAGVPVETMKEVSENFFKAYPGVRDLMDSIIALGEKRTREEGVPYIILPSTGRRLVTEPGAEYRLVNYLLQGSCAEITKRALINVDQADLSQYAMLVIHDEILFSFPKDQAEELAAQAAEAMSFTSGEYLVPQVAEAEVAGDRWGAKYH